MPTEKTELKSRLALDRFVRAVVCHDSLHATLSHSPRICFDDIERAIFSAELVGGACQGCKFTLSDILNIVSLM